MVGLWSPEGRHVCIHEFFSQFYTFSIKACLFVYHLNILENLESELLKIQSNMYLTQNCGCTVLEFAAPKPKQF